MLEKRSVGLDEDRLAPGVRNQRSHVTEVVAVDLDRGRRLDTGRERREKGDGGDDASHRVASSSPLATPT